MNGRVYSYVKPTPRHNGLKCYISVSHEFVMQAGVSEEKLNAIRIGEKISIDTGTEYLEVERIQ